MLLRKRRVFAVSAIAVYTILILKLSWEPSLWNNLNHWYPYRSLNNFVVRKDAKKGIFCEPIHSLVYIKTHKTGGSSISKLLGKYVKKYSQQPNKYKQIDILPGPYFGGYPGLFRRQLAYQIPNGIEAKDLKNASSIRYAIGHLRFNKDELCSMMNKNTKYLTILRNPLRQLESAFQYYYGKYFEIAQENDKHPVEGIKFSRHLACHPEPFLTVTRKLGVTYAEYIPMANKSLNKDVPWFYRGSNSQAFDLGLDPKGQGEVYVLGKAKELEPIFDLVMITEYFLESLILLKDTLCMSWDDLLGPVINMGNYDPHIYTPEEEEQVRSLNKQLMLQDFILYNYFNQTFWRKVDAYGRERMEKDKTFLESFIEKNQEKTPQVRNVIRQKLEHLGAYVPRTEGRDYFVHRMAISIEKEIGHDLPYDKVLEVAGYMFDNGGWCPHRHQRL